MKRALGAVTTWDTFQKMTEGDAGAASEIVAPSTHVHVAPHVHEAANVHHESLPHSRESQVAHKAVHGGEELPHKHVEPQPGSPRSQQQQPQSGVHAGEETPQKHVELQPGSPRSQQRPVGASSH